MSGREQIIIEVIKLKNGKRHVLERFTHAEVEETVAIADEHARVWILWAVRHALRSLPPILRKKIYRSVWDAGFKKFNTREGE